MSRHGLKLAIGAAALLLAPIGFAAAPARAQVAEPTPQSDFSCFVLLAVRRAQLINNVQIPADEKAQTVRNLDVVMAFYQGRISQYSMQGALELFNNARNVVSQLNQQQSGIEAQRCASLYEGVDAIIQNMGRGIDPAAR